MVECGSWRRQERLRANVSEARWELEQKRETRKISKKRAYLLCFCFCFCLRDATACYAWHHA